MLRAVFTRDKSYDGIFFSAIKTTSILYRQAARPSPKEENILFYASAREAMFAGFRACKRCKPLELSGTHPDWVKSCSMRLITPKPNACRIGSSAKWVSSRKEPTLFPQELRHNISRLPALTKAWLCALRKIRKAQQLTM